MWFHQSLCMWLCGLNHLILTTIPFNSDIPSALQIKRSLQIRRSNHREIKYFPKVTKLIRYTWVMFWPCSLSTEIILEPICKIALGHFLGQAHLYTPHPGLCLSLVLPLGIPVSAYPTWVWASREGSQKPSSLTSSGCCIHMCGTKEEVKLTENV